MSVSVEDNRKYQRDWYARNKNHPKVRERSRKASENWRKANPDRRRAAKFGLTKAELDTMILEQNNLCAICHQPETALNNNKTVKPLSIDHNHEINQVRGLLCHRCNVALGLMKDSSQLLQNAAAYLDFHAMKEAIA